MKTKSLHTISLLITGLFLVFAFATSGEKEPVTYGDMDTEAFVIAQNFVKKQLKSPSTAKFPSHEYKTAYLGNNKIQVVGTVDSQNSFGAMIRSRFIVHMTWNGNEWADINNWTLDDIAIQ